MFLGWGWDGEIYIGKGKMVVVGRGWDGVGDDMWGDGVGWNGDGRLWVAGLKDKKMGKVFYK